MSHQGTEHMELMRPKRGALNDCLQRFGFPEVLFSRPQTAGNDGARQSPRSSNLHRDADLAAAFQNDLAENFAKINWHTDATIRHRCMPLLSLFGISCVRRPSFSVD
jgi:hypothetical protein